jgi:hypothetical protein
VDTVTYVNTKIFDSLNAKPTMMVRIVNGITDFLVTDVTELVLM